MAKGSKHRERELAFQTLYGLSFSPAADLEQLVLAYQRSPYNAHGTGEPKGMAWNLIRGTWENEEKLDADIERFSINWRTDRIGRIEHILLRLALYEIKFTDVPPKVVIAEYLELADSFGVSAATSFMNGILDAAARARAGALKAGEQLA